MFFSKLSIALFLSCFTLSVSAATYTLVPNFFNFDGDNVSQVTAASVSGSYVTIAQRDDAFPFFYVFSTSTIGGKPIRTWGNTTILDSPHGMHDDRSIPTDVWICDIAGNVVILFDSLSGERKAVIGTGKKGNSIEPLEFSAIADVATLPNGALIFSDGDGGSNSRVSRVDINSSSPSGYSTSWVIGGNGTNVGQFQSPHSVAFQYSNNIAWIADRGNNRLQALDSDTGKVLGVWNNECFNNGEPWGVRVDEQRHVLIVADGLYGNVYILNLDDAGPKGSFGKCSSSTLLQTLVVGVALKPHELAIDYSTGDFYLANVGTPPSAQKYSYNP